MRKALLLVMLLAVVVWAVNRFIWPILPDAAYSWALLFVAALSGVPTLLASMKAIIELWEKLTGKESRDHVRDATVHSTSEIRRVLHASDQELPTALSLCLGLCEQHAELDRDYATWIRRELNGCGDLEAFSEELKHWADNWAGYRLIPWYFKLSSKGKISKFPFGTQFVSQPLAHLVTEMDTVKRRGGGELSTPVSNLHPKILEGLRSAAKDVSEQGIPAADVYLFSDIQDANEILVAVRNRVEEMLKEAGKLVA